MRISAYFVSDLHLGEPEDQRTQLFLKFLKGLRGQSNCTHLFMLGDIFDLWIAHHFYFIYKFAVILEQLQRLLEEGVVIHYFEGNHDLYLKKYWQDELKICVHEGPVHIELDDLILRLEHGDEINPNDKGYIFLRWWLRTPLMKWVAHHLPENLLVQLGKLASQGSRQYTSEIKTQSQAMAKMMMLDHAHRVFSSQYFDLLIAGHLHVHEDRQVSEEGTNFRIINLGSWLEQPQVLRLAQLEEPKGDKKLWRTTWLSPDSF